MLWYESWLDTRWRFLIGLILCLLAAGAAVQGHVQPQWLPALLGALFAAVLGSGSRLIRGGPGAPAMHPLPPSRLRRLGARAGVGALQVLALTLVPSLAISWLSGTGDEAYDARTALVQGLCAFVVASLFFSLATLISTRLAGSWRPLLATAAVAVAIGALETVLQTPTGPFATLAAESYARNGRVPWDGIAVNLALAVALYVVAARRVEKSAVTGAA